MLEEIEPGKEVDEMGTKKKDKKPRRKKKFIVKVPAKSQLEAMKKARNYVPKGYTLYIKTARRPKVSYYYVIGELRPRQRNRRRSK